MGVTATCEQLDVRQEEQVVNFFKKIETQHGQIDILVNSAAVYPRSTIDSLKLSEWREVIDTNLTGAFIVLKYASEIMKKKANGKIIFSFRILVFDKGHIVEDGRHTELLKLCGLYKTLWEAQVGGFLPDERKEEPEDLADSGGVDE